MSQIAEPQVAPSAKRPQQGGPRRPVPIVPKMKEQQSGGDISRKPMPKPKPRAAVPSVNQDNNIKGGRNKGSNSSNSTSSGGVGVVGQQQQQGVVPGDSDTMTRTKVILNEAADAVAKSFTKQTQGINKGKTKA